MTTRPAPPVGMAWCTLCCGSEGLRQAPRTRVTWESACPRLELQPDAKTDKRAGAVVCTRAVGFIVTTWHVFLTAWLRLIVSSCRRVPGMGEGVPRWKVRAWHGMRQAIIVSVGVSRARG